MEILYIMEKLYIMEIVKKIFMEIMYQAPAVRKYNFSKIPQLSPYNYSNRERFNIQNELHATQQTPGVPGGAKKIKKFAFLC